MIKRFSDLRFDEAIAILLFLIVATAIAIFFVRREGRRTSKSARFDITGPPKDKTD